MMRVINNYHDMKATVTNILTTLVLLLPTPTRASLPSVLTTSVSGFTNCRWDLQFFVQNQFSFLLQIGPQVFPKEPFSTFLLPRLRSIPLLYLRPPVLPLCFHSFLSPHWPHCYRVFVLPLPSAWTALPPETHMVKFLTSSPSLFKCHLHEEVYLDHTF